MTDDRMDPMTTAELKLLANRERERVGKAERRARQAEEKAAVAIKPNADGYTIPPMPAGVPAIRKWVRQAHDAYSNRKIGPLELTEIRRSAASVGDLFKVGAEIRKAEA